MEQLMFDLYLNSPSKPMRQKQAVEEHKKEKLESKKFAF